jgi:hypothetical protein
MYSISGPYAMQYSSLLAEVQVQVAHFERSEVAYFRVLSAYEMRTRPFHRE